MSLVDLKELNIVAKSGIKMIIDPSVSKIYLLKLAFLSAFFIGLLLLDFKFLRYSQLDNRNNRNQEKQDNSNGIGITKLIALKSIVVYQKS